MPIFEFRCNACQHEFETLVLKTTVPACTACGSADLERLLSLPNVKSETTHNLAMRAAKRRDQKAGHERTQEQLIYEKSHDD